jgi:hypothetical protein
LGRTALPDEVHGLFPGFWRTNPSPRLQNILNAPIIQFFNLSNPDPLLIAVWHEFQSMSIQDMRKYACREHTLPVIKQRFMILCTAIGNAKDHVAAAGSPRVLLFPPLRSKKIFILNELVAVHSLQLYVLAQEKSYLTSWILINGNERVPSQNEITNALDVAAQSARYAVEHIVVDSIYFTN